MNRDSGDIFKFVLQLIVLTILIQPLKLIAQDSTAVNDFNKKVELEIVDLSQKQIALYKSLRNESESRRKTVLRDSLYYLMRSYGPVTQMD